jgi:DNA modification methylase
MHGIERNDVSGWKQETNKGSVSQGSRTVEGCKAKDLIGIPWMLAFALRADGWYLRQEIIWEKPACMPESVGDRPTRSHEQVFLLAKAAKYYYNADAIKEQASADTHARYARGRSDNRKYADGGPGGQTIARSLEHMRKPGVNPKAAANNEGSRQNESFSHAVKDVVEFRNKRSVWRIANEPNTEEHFAAFPIKLVEPCIFAGSPPGGSVLDPFAGLGTVGNACLKHGRDFVGIELNPEYVRMAQERVDRHYPLLAGAP